MARPTLALIRSGPFTPLSYLPHHVNDPFLIISEYRSLSLPLPDHSNAYWLNVSEQLKVADPHYRPALVVGS